MSKQPTTEYHHLDSATRKRILIDSILEGPRGIEMPLENGDLFYGWPQLHLGLRPTAHDASESRVVFANLFDKSQGVAILRAVTWDRQISAQRSVVSNAPKHARPKLPARFVVVSTSDLMLWLSEFKNIRTAIDDDCGANRSLKLRRLRIERDYLSCIQEKVWRHEAPRYSRLNRRWDRVWKNMTEVLMVSPPITDFSEVFWFLKGHVRYDHRSYKPIEVP